MMAKTLKSVFSRVYALRRRLDMTAGGIVIPEEARSMKVDVARLLLMGDECKLTDEGAPIELPFKEGDDVLVCQYAYKIIDTNLLKLNGYDLAVPEGQELLVFNVTDILGVFVDADA
jgi:co-chaperonin GroES (HSP10)